jgi:hypothetical protein
MRNVTESAGHAIRRPKARHAGRREALPAPIEQFRMAMAGRNNSTAEVAPADLTFRQAAGKLGP